MAGQPRIRLGTRGSALARWQAEWVASELTALGVAVEMIHIKTAGDVTSGPLGEIGGQGLFTKEIQRALLDERIDLAVHSLKDLPTEQVPGLRLGAVPPRERAGDAFVSQQFATLDALPRGGKIGTGSARRRAQLLYHRPDLMVEDIRGNVDSRLAKLDAGEYAAIVLAEAGLVRLELSERITQVIPREIMLPAVGQGALGLEIREADESTATLLAPLNHPPTHAMVAAERAMLAALRGGCLAPVGVWSRIEDEQLLVDAVVLNAVGNQRVDAAHAGAPDEAVSIGLAVADSLLGLGAAELLAEARRPA